MDYFYTDDNLTDFSRHTISYMCISGFALLPGLSMHTRYCNNNVVNFIFIDINILLFILILCE